MATLYAKPKEIFESSFEGAPTGLVGTVGYTIFKLSDGGVLQARKTAGIAEVPANSGSYYSLVTAPTELGSYAITWDSGVISPTTAASDTLIVTAAGRPPEAEPTANNLISLERLKIAKGDTSVNPTRDAKYEAAIAFASEAIRKFTDRSFGLPIKNETRIYDYDISGLIDIDDASVVEMVEFKLGNLVTPVQSYAWRAEPQSGPPFDYLVIPHWAGVYSPEMGFTYNLDIISKERGWPGTPPVVLVKGSYGWPEVPYDVQEAAILVAAEFSENPNENVSESIENYTYSKGGSRAFGAAESVAISGRAKDLLNPYVRPLI